LELGDDQHIGIHSKFFQVGGHSLLLTRLISKINGLFKKSISITQAYEKQTIAELALLCAEAIEQNTDYVGLDEIIMIHSGGSRKLFLIHSGAGTAFPYFNLIPHLTNTNLPTIYGINNPRFTQPNNQFTSIEEMAKCYIGMIQKKYDQFSDFDLGGWSLGGIIGIEMAIQLASVGINVGRVFMFDSMNLDALSLDIKCGMIESREKWVSDGVLKNYQENIPGELNLLQISYESSAALALHYSPKLSLVSESTQLVLLKAQNKNLDFIRPLNENAQLEFTALSKSEGYGWTPGLKNLIVDNVPGDHYQLMDPENSVFLVHKLMSYYQL